MHYKQLFVLWAVVLTACGSSTALIDEDSPLLIEEFSLYIDYPEANQIVTSPLTISGSAIGPWYFEASFPVELLDGDGFLIAQTVAQAQGEWMTTDFVPFTATLTFATPATATGTLVLKKDNPSGLPENDASISVPVSF